MKSAICFGSEIYGNIVQPTLPSKNKIVPELSEHDCTIYKICSKTVLVNQNHHDSVPRLFEI
jgi:hypothetical protein